MSPDRCSRFPNTSCRLTEPASHRAGCVTAPLSFPMDLELLPGRGRIPGSLLYKSPLRIPGNLFPRELVSPRILPDWPAPRFSSSFPHTHTLSAPSRTARVGCFFFFPTLPPSQTNSVCVYLPQRWIIFPSIPPPSLGTRTRGPSHPTGFGAPRRGPRAPGLQPQMDFCFGSLRFDCFKYTSKDVYSTRRVRQDDED